MFPLKPTRVFALAVCLGSLPCWKVNLRPQIFGRLKPVSLYLAPSIIPSILTGLQVPTDWKHPHSMMPPCFTVLSRWWEVRLLTADFSCQDRSSLVTARPGCGRWSHWRWRPAGCRPGGVSSCWLSDSSARTLGRHPGVCGLWCLQVVGRPSRATWRLSPGPQDGGPSGTGTAGVWLRQNSSFSDDPQRWLWGKTHRGRVRGEKRRSCFKWRQTAALLMRLWDTEAASKPPAWIYFW